MNNAINIFSIILFAVCWFLIIKKWVWNKVASVKTIEAKVVDKYKSDIASKYPGSFMRERYIVVFETKEKNFYLMFRDFHIVTIIGLMKREF